MDPDFDKINHFIYSKIDNYNKHFDAFQKNLNIQDNKIRTVCRNKVNETIKKNPKKTAQQFANLTTMNETDDTSENDYFLEKNNIKNIEKTIKNSKKVMEGGNYDTETDISGEVEIIEEEIEKNIIKNKNYINYNFMYTSIIIVLFLYVIIYLLLILFKYEIDSEGIFKPLLFITEKIYPEMIKKNE